MKKFLVSIALASTVLTAASPALAQRDYQDQRYGDRYDRGDDRRYDRDDDRRNDRGIYRGQDLKPRLDRISIQVSRLRQRGQISNREAQQLGYEHRSIWEMARQFGRSGGGFDHRERVALDRRIDRLQERVRMERRDEDRRDYR